MLKQAARAAGEEEKQDGILSLRGVGGEENCFLRLFGDSVYWFFFVLFKSLILINSEKINFLRLLLCFTECSKQIAQCIPSTDKIGKYLWRSKAVCALSLIHRCIGSSAEGAGGTWLSAG